MRTTTLFIAEQIADMPVTATGKNAFNAGEHIDALYLPNGLRIIGSAFIYCKRLVLKRLPESLKYIPRCAFNNCSDIDETLEERLYDYDEEP